MAHILIYSNNPQLIADCTHILIGEHSVNRLLNVHNNFEADAIIIDAKKLDDETTPILFSASRRMRLLIVGEDWSDPMQLDALVRGAAGYCEQLEIANLLSRAVDSILQGDIWIRRGLVPKVIEILTGNSALKHSANVPEDFNNLLKMAESLSTRESEVADMIRSGENNKTIAHRMNISERTVKAHLSSIFRKFEVDDRLHLAVRLKEIDKFK
ncbi:MAG: response regulator transcription factor [Gammaproteobacteria bacterium]